MKKLLAIVLACVMLFGLAACGEDAPAGPAVSPVLYKNGFQAFGGTNVTPYKWTETSRDSNIFHYVECGFNDADFLVYEGVNLAQAENYVSVLNKQYGDHQSLKLDILGLPIEELLFHGDVIYLKDETNAFDSNPIDSYAELVEMGLAKEIAGDGLDVRIGLMDCMFEKTNRNTVATDTLDVIYVPTDDEIRDVISDASITGLVKKTTGYEGVNIIGLRENTLVVMLNKTGVDQVLFNLDSVLNSTDLIDLLIDGIDTLIDLNMR